MQVLHDTFADDPAVTVLAVHFDDRGDPAAYMEQHGYTFPWVADGGAIADAYGIAMLPTFVVVGPDGIVVDKHAGTLSDAARQRLADAARAARR